MIQPPASAAPGRSASRLTSLMLVIGLFVAVGGLAFAIGRITAPAAAASSGVVTGAGFPGAGFGGAGFAAGGNGTNGTNGAAGGFGAAGELILKGTVAAISPESLTLKLANGTTLVLPLDATTTYHRQDAASPSDVRPGSSVALEVAGFGRFGGQPNASFSPDPNRTPNPNRTPSFGPARDITIVAP